MDKVIIASVEDRLTVAAILVKNDYTVRQGKQLRQGKKATNTIWSTLRTTSRSRRQGNEDAILHLRGAAR